MSLMTAGWCLCATPRRIGRRCLCMRTSPSTCSSRSYYITADRAEHDNCDWVPEASRRARGFTVYAALRFLGRKGIAELVDRCCRLARRMAERLASDPSVTILNEVVLNQVLVRFSDASGRNSDEFTAEVI